MSTVQFFKGTSSKVTSATKQANSFYNDTDKNILYFCDNDNTLHRLNSDTAAKTTSLSWGDSSTIATIDGNNIKVIMPAKPVTGITAGKSGTNSNASVSNPYIKIKDDSTYRSQIQLEGSEGIEVKSNASGKITIKPTFVESEPTVRTNCIRLIGTPDDSDLALLYDSGTYLDASNGHKLYNEGRPVINRQFYDFDSFYQGVAPAGIYLLTLFTTTGGTGYRKYLTTTIFSLPNNLNNYQGSSKMPFCLITAPTLHVTGSAGDNSSYPLIISNAGGALFNIDIGDYTYSIVIHAFVDTSTNPAPFDYELIRLA